MRHRQLARSRHVTLPRIWLMTDERQGATPWRALARLPRGAGIVLRHHATPPVQRRALYDRIRRVARARGLMLLLAGTAAQAARWRADGAHGLGRGRRRASAPLRTMAVHDHAQAIAARRAGADLVFISPVRATRSHPGARPLGPLRFALLARAAGRPAIALGGMDARHAARLPRGYGWAGIDAWTHGAPQKRKAVPT